MKQFFLRRKEAYFLFSLHLCGVWRREVGGSIAWEEHGVYSALIMGPFLFSVPSSSAYP